VIELVGSFVATREMGKIQNKQKHQLRVVLNSLAKAVSISPAHVNGLLHELRMSGKVLLDVGKNGTRVKLVA
jgi:hypothetical protein